MRPTSVLNCGIQKVLLEVPDTLVNVIFIISLRAPLLGDAELETRHRQTLYTQQGKKMDLHAMGGGLFDCGRCERGPRCDNFSGFITT